jgi:isoprenylcysteine carboxyl methyltransferase (ICMT) family protein YpbQ
VSASVRQALAALEPLSIGILAFVTLQTGPYRFISHPNYIVVAGEILVLPPVFGLVAFALVFSALNGLALWVRIRVENAAVRSARRCG